MPEVTLLNQHDLIAGLQQYGHQQNLSQSYGYAQSTNSPIPVLYLVALLELIHAATVGRGFAVPHSQSFWKLGMQIARHPLDLVHIPKSQVDEQTYDYFYATGRNLMRV